LKQTTRRDRGQAYAQARPTAGLRLRNDQERREEEEKKELAHGGWNYPRKIAQTGESSVGVVLQCNHL
jgi:hypothetical protein